MKLRPSVAIGFATWLLLLLLMPATAAPRQVTRGHVPAVVANLKPAGDFPGTNHLNLAIGLPLRNQKALTQLLREIYNPASPRYHHYLTPEQFTEQFGPTEKDYRAVIAFAKANGLTVTGMDPTRMLVDVSGSVADIDRALHMTLRVYQHPTEKRMFHAPDAEPSLDLAVPILRISGLDNYSLPCPRLQATPLANAAKALPNAGSGPGGAYMGKDFRAAYVPDSSLNGSGQIVGLLQFDGYTASDITYYENQAGLPSITLSNVLIDGATGNPSGSGGEVEVSLDIEMAISMATNLSKVIIYMAPNPSPWEDLLKRMANDNLAKQLSCSWYQPGAAANTNADQIFLQMAAQGQSFFSASGDYDAYTGLIPFPGDTPCITQVGGTTLTTSGPEGAWVSETVWNRGNGIGSGGGISTQYPIPSWQTNINMTANQGSTTKRNTPDVALTAENVYVRANGRNYHVGGTSCAAPLWAGFTALANQQAAASGKPTVGFINPAVDMIGSGPNFTTSFHDITTGNNTSPGSPTKFYAVTGYDLCTGWGTPAGQSLIDALANPEALVITPATGFASIGGVGGPFTITSQSLSLTNAGTNSLTWTLANTSVWLNASPSGGILTPGGAAATVTVSLNTATSNLLVGTYGATLWFTNLNSGVGQSRQFALSVISPPAITTQPADQAVLEGATAMFTVGATGGLPLFYQWQDNGTNLTDGGNISGSTTTNLTISHVSPADVGTYDVIVTNFAGVAASSNALLTITPSPPVIIQQPADQTAVVGETAAFTVAAIGNTPFFYQWSFNGTNISGATNATLALANVQLTQAGSYAVVLTNALGSTTSSNAILTVYTVPVITSFSPPSGTAGTVVNISGLNFDPTPGNNIVYFGAVQAAVTAASATNLVVTVPSGATYAPITETVNGLVAYSGTLFMPTFAGNGTAIGPSTFGPRLDMNSPSGPTHTAIGDLDGDGKPDLVLGSAYDHMISIYQNLSTNGPLTTNSFAARVDLPSIGGNSDNPADIKVADVDGDGKLDLVACDRLNNQILVYRNLSTGGTLTTNSFAAPVAFEIGAEPRYVQVADLDGDGRPDMICANYADNTISLLQNIGVAGSLTTNSFAAHVDLPAGAGAFDVAVGDLDGDGRPDLAVVNNGGSSVSIYRNLMTGPGVINTNSFAPQIQIPASDIPMTIAIGDVDGDGKPDLVIGSWGGQSMSVYRNLASPGSLSTDSFASRIDFGTTGWTHIVALGDLNGDTKPDIALVAEMGSAMSVFQNLSTPGSFTNSSLAGRVDYATGWNPWGISVGDLDGDGRPDVVFGNCYDNTISIYQNATPFGGPPVITTQPANQAVYVGFTANFSVTAMGSLPLSYQWSFGGTNIVGVTNTMLTLTNVQLDQAGNYAVLVTNVYGSVLSSNAVLTVIPPASCAPMPSGLVDWWPGEGNANDIVGINNGTLVNGATFTNGEVGQAFSFDGTSYVSIPDSPSLDAFTNSITMELWMKAGQTNANSDWKGIVTKGGSSWRLQGTTWAKSVTFSLTSVNSNVDLIGSRNVNDGQWHHVAAVYNGTNMFLYVDGTLDVSQPATGMIAQNSSPVCIGENAQMPGYLFNGLIDEVSLYNRALTALEIQAICAAGSGGKCYVPMPPVITTQPANQAVYVGFTANFSVTAMGSLPLSYQWSFGGTNIVGATNTTLTLTNVQLNQAGNYAVLVTNVYGWTNSAAAVLTINPPPPGVPVITGFNPISGIVGTSVTIGGTNFSPVVASNIVYFGAVRAAVTAASPTNLVVTVPAGAIYAPITETVNGLTAYANSSFLPTFPGGGTLSSSSLSGPTNLTAGSGPFLTVIRDLDGDGKPDVIVANASDGTVYIYRNISTNGTLGAASFVSPVILTTIGGGLYGLTLADVDGDGRLDIVVANYNNNDVSIFQNLCSPGGITTNSFAARVDFPVGSAPNGVTGQDLDGDGKPEIVTANSGGTVSILRNLGTLGSITTNSFAPAVNFTVGPNSKNVMIADVDGDGKADVVTVNNGSSSQAMSVLRNLSTLGNISFATNIDFPGLATSYSLAIGDLDGDGKPDVVIGSQPSGQAVSVFRNTSTPGNITTNSFVPRVDFATGGWANSVAIGDLDGDGKPDVAVATQISSHLSLFKNTSTPGSFTTNSFAARVDFAAGSNPSGVAIGDLNGDSQPDIVFANTYSSTISIYRNVVPLLPFVVTQPTNQTVTAGSNATFTVMAGGTPPLSYQWKFNGTNIAGASNTSLTLTNVQLSQAGDYAVLVTNLFGSILSSNAVLTVNSPPPGVPVITGFNPISGIVGTSVTISGTNFSPVAASNIVYFGAVRAAVTAASPTNLVVTVPSGATYAPLTVTVNGLVAYSSTLFMPTFVGNGTAIGPATFGPRLDMNSPSGPLHTVIGDLDGDGKPDLVLGTAYDHMISIYQNLSTNGPLTADSFAARVDLPSIGGDTDNPVGIEVADVDGDGKLDIVACDRINNQILVYRNLSTGGTLTTNSFAVPVAFEVGADPRYVRVVDLDGDGRPDMVCANYAGNTISLLQNIGVAGSLTTSSFAAHVDLPAGAGAFDVAVGDLDGDGRPDLAVDNEEGASVSIYRNLMTGPGVINTNSFAPQIQIPAPDNPLTIAIGDVDGDGKPDLVIGSWGGQSMSVYRNLASPGSLSTDSFASRIDFGTTGWTHNVTLGDLNGDAKPDIALVAEVDSAMSVFQNLSTPGSFTNSSLAGRVDYATGWNPWGISVGDLDGDGRPDVVFGNCYDNTISIYQNATPFGGPPVITGQPTNQTVAVGNAATFSVTADGALPLSYQWNFNGTNIDGATNTTLILTNVQVSQAGNYTVLVTNLFGSILSSNAVLVVTLDHFAWNPIPSPRFVNTPFSVIIRAQDLTNGIFTNFTGTAILGTTNGVAVTPPVSGNFMQGVWTGSVMIAQTATNLVLQADDGLGHFGLANPINVISLPRLGMLHSGNIALYMWPVGYPGFVLETSGNLSPATWVVVPYSPIQIGDQYLLPLDMTGTNGFYRLWFPGP